MSDEFIRKDIHDVQIEALHREIDGLKDRISDAESKSAKQVSFWGITTAVIAFLFAGLQVGIAITLYFLSLLKP